MRDTFRIAILAALFLVGCSTYDRELLGDPEPAQPAAAASTEETVVPPADESMGVGDFDELRYYGQWRWIDPYGWAWRPTVVTEWQPFVNGHWIWSQYGWTWVDYDPWGWATAHYGYWMFDYAMGWVWIPDYTWSPAQVDWLMYDDWACWSPVPPSGVRFKEPWEGDDAWVSVPVRRFKDPNVGIYRAVPKYKAGESEQTMTRTAPQVAPGVVPIKVQLERHVVGEREFAKVKFPADQEQIIEGQRLRAKTNSNTAQFIPQPAPQSAPASNGGGTVGPTKPPTEVKSKPASSGTKNGNNSGKKETKFKEKKSDEKKKDDGKSKDNSKPRDDPKSDKKEKG